MNYCNYKPMEHGLKQKCSSCVSTGENIILYIKDVKKNILLKIFIHANNAF